MSGMQSNKAVLTALLVTLGALSGCGGAIRCGDPGPYMQASPRPPLVLPDGLERPPEGHRIRVPEGADVVHPELRGQAVENPDGTLRCLESPPPLQRRDLIQG